MMRYKRQIRFAHPTTESLCSNTLSFGMANDDILRKLITKLTADTEAYRAEAQRLESSDRSRHATSISMLEVSAQAIAKCIRDAETMR
jgi:hypothetical protein